MFFSINEKKLSKWKKNNEVVKLTQAVNNKETQISTTAFNLLQEILHEDLSAWLLECIDSSSREVRLGALKGLLKAQNRTSISPLLHKYDNLDALLKKLTIRLFGMMHAEEAISLLVKELKTETDPELLEEIKKSLILMGAASTQALEAVIAETKEPQIKKDILEIFSKTRDVRTLPYLRDAVASPIEHVSELGIQGLINLGNNAVNDALTLIDDEKTAEAGCRIIAKVGNNQQIAAVKKVLQSQDKTAIASALLALSEISEGHPEVLEDIMQVYENEAYRDLKIEKGLSGKAAEKAREEIADENRKNRAIRNNCITAMGATGSSKVHDILLSALSATPTHDAAIEAILKNGKELIFKAMRKDKKLEKEILFAAKKHPVLEKELLNWMDEFHKSQHAF